MVTYLGEDEFTYEVVEGWANIPADLDVGEVAAVAVDSQDRVYVFNRGRHPMIVLSTDGEFLSSWGEGLFPKAHGLSMGPDESIYCTDEGSHCVRKCTLDGEVLLELGVPGQPAPYMSGEPFNRCTHTALSPSGDIYVSDGYGNPRVHRYSSGGQYLRSWGESGVGPGQFNLPHNIACDAEGNVYVADRENHRIQVFDGDGVFKAVWHDLHRPSALYAMPGPTPTFFVGEIGPVFKHNRGASNLGPRISVVDHCGRVLTRLGRGRGLEAGEFMAPHSIAVDSYGSIYVGEVSKTHWPQVHPDTPMPSPLRCLQKLRKVGPLAPGGA